MLRIQRQSFDLCLGARNTDGARTAQGSPPFALTISVIVTRRKHDVLPWPSLAEVIRRRRKGESTPPLPQPAL